MYGSPVVPPGGQFPVPATSDTPLLAFRCTSTFKPYVAEDVTLNNAGFIMDTAVTHTQVQGAKPIDLEPGVDFILVSISAEQTIPVVDVPAPVNTIKFEVPFSLVELTPRKKPYDVSCSATYPTSDGP